MLNQDVRGRESEGRRLRQSSLGELRAREENPYQASTFQVSDVVHTARRATASIGEGFNHHLTLGGDPVPQIDRRGLGEGRLAIATGRDAVGLQ